MRKWLLILPAFLYVRLVRRYGESLVAGVGVSDGHTVIVMRKLARLHPIASEQTADLVCNKGGNNV